MKLCRSNLVYSEDFSFRMDGEYRPVYLLGDGFALVEDNFFGSIDCLQLVNKVTYFQQAHYESSILFLQTMVLGDNRGYFLFSQKIRFCDLDGFCFFLAKKEDFFKVMEIPGIEILDLNE